MGNDKAVALLVVSAALMPAVLMSVALMSVALMSVAATAAEHTTLTDSDLKYTVPNQHFVVMRRGPIEAIIADNHAVDDRALPGHQAGYSGLASIKHDRRPENLFVKRYAGLNFEHIHDGRTLDRRVLFEPRNAPMQLRQIDRHTVELYQPPTPTWKLESCQRFTLLPDGTIELTIELIPRAATFRNGYVGLFWASYIDQPESLDIHFRGRRDFRDRRDGQGDESTWIRGVTPEHGVDATHRRVDDNRGFTHDADFPMFLVFHDSPHRYTDDWYYGVSHGMAWLTMVRPQDQIRFSQSPSGGGKRNPAWDFQAFVSPFEVDRVYRLVVRAMYVPFESVEQLERLSRPHLDALSRQR